MKKESIDVKQPLIDIVDQEESSLLQSGVIDPDSPGSLSISTSYSPPPVLPSSYTRRINFTSTKLTVREWTVIILGAVAMVSLMTYLIYTIIYGSTVLYVAQPKDKPLTSNKITIVNYHPHTVIEGQHGAPADVQRQDYSCGNMVNTSLAEYLISDYKFHHKHSTPIQECPSIDQKIITAAKLRAIHKSEGFSSSVWLRNESFQFADLFEYDVELDSGRPDNSKSHRVQKLGSDAQSINWAKLAMRIRNDPVRLEKMAKYHLYGAFIFESVLVEIWVNRT